MDNVFPTLASRFSCPLLLGVSSTFLLLTPVAAVGGDEAVRTATAKPVDFLIEVAPILQQHCVDCHGPKLQLADLRLDRQESVLVDGRERDLVKPGHSKDSLLIRRLVDKTQGLIMPPSFPFFPEDRVGLPEEKIRTIKRWIDEGATWPNGVVLADETKTPTDIPGAKTLLAAIRANDHEAVSVVLSDRSLVNITDRHGSTPLMYAALYADAALLRRLIVQGANINAADKCGATALMWAAGDLGKVRLLVDHGAQVDARSDLGRTPLLIAATYVGNTDVVKYLLKSGAKITERDEFGETVLTSASKRGDVQLVATLLQAGADPQRGGGFVGRTPLAWAAEEGNLETVALLLKHGASRDPKGLNMALFNAAVRGPSTAVKLLIDQGADVNAPSGFAGYTPLMGAAYSEHVSSETVRLLLDQGAQKQTTSATGETALQVARKRGRTEIVSLLEGSGVTPVAAAPVTIPRDALPKSVREAAERSLSLLQKCGPEFFRKSGCVACHQQSVTSLAIAEARTRGFHVDEQIAREQVQVAQLTIKSFRDRLLQRVDHPLNSAPSVGYILWGLSAENALPDEFTDALVIEMANRQAPDGSWTDFGHRPPLEYSRIAATAVAVKAMQNYGPPGLKASFDERINRARDWLLAAQPAANIEHAFRLLGLAWSAAGASPIKPQVEILLARQRSDGGWAELDTLGSDAHATGLALYALYHAGGVATTHPAYVRGVNYLLQTQLDDGSWHVPSRSFPFQAYFESGFPHGADQWISAAATGFAAAALIDSIPLPKP